MKLYCFYTAAYQDLFDRWFAPSAALEYDLGVHRDPDALAVDYKQNGWLPIVRRKVDFILKAVSENRHRPFVFSDPDVQFFGPTRTPLLRSIGNRDLVFQKDAPGLGAVCTGFFVCRGNERTLRFWSAVRESMDGSEDRDDQDCARALLLETLPSWFTGRAARSDRPRSPAAWLSQRRLNPFALRWGCLPSAFLGGGTLTGRLWQPGMTLPIPDPVLMHHANYTVGLQNKVAQLRYVREVVTANLSSPNRGACSQLQPMLDNRAYVNQRPQ